MIVSRDGTKWRTNSFALVQTITSTNQKYKDMRLPLFVRQLGRFAKEYRQNKEHQKVYIRKIDYKNKNVHYEIQKCDECDGDVVYNRYEEKECNKCGLIHENIIIYNIKKYRL